MATFQVTARTVGTPAAARKPRTRTRRRWLAVLRYVRGISVIGGLFALTIAIVRSDVLFILLPVGLSIVITAITARSQLDSLKALLLTTGVALLYFGGITGWELFTHDTKTAEIIVVTTTLAAAVIFEPLRVLLLNFLEQIFHIQHDATSQSIAAFTATLREEIDQEQVNDRFLTVVQRLLRPQSVALWVRLPIHVAVGMPPASLIVAPPAAAPPGQPASAPLAAADDQWNWAMLPAANATAVVADQDPLLAFALDHPSTLELDQLQLDSPALRRLRQHGVELLVPLASQGELLGLLALGPRVSGQTEVAPSWGRRVLDLLAILYPFTDRQRDYTREDRGVLNTLAAQVAPALRVVRLVREQQARVRERDQIEQELRTAQRIQRTFLPKDVPPLPGWQLVPYYQPAREVGGDFYDFLSFEDGRVGLIIGDVTGKGIPAALMMTATRTMLRTAAQQQATPGTVFERVNEVLHADIAPGMFVTCFYVLLDPRTGDLRFANAGHEPPYRRHAGCVSELWATGMPLGLMPGIQYEEYQATLAPGESLLFYSDGLVEAHNPAREMFGFPRLKTLLEAPESGAAGPVPQGETLIAALLAALARFTGDSWEQEDDVTMLTLYREAHR
jgi:serine phosphatase RsbU (regulator of sigma subunit)